MSNTKSTRTENYFNRRKYLLKRIDHLAIIGLTILTLIPLVALVKQHHNIAKKETGIILREKKVAHEEYQIKNVIRPKLAQRQQKIESNEAQINQILSNLKNTGTTSNQ